MIANKLAVLDSVQPQLASAGRRPVDTQCLKRQRSEAAMPPIRYQMGHGDVGFTARVYAHVTARLQLDAAAKLSAYLEPATTLAM